MKLIHKDIKDLKFQGYDYMGKYRGWFQFQSEHGNLVFREPTGEEFYLKGDQSPNAIAGQLEGSKCLVICGGKLHQANPGARIIIKRTRLTKIPIKIDPEALEHLVLSGKLKHNDFYKLAKYPVNLDGEEEC